MANLNLHLLDKNIKFNRESRILEKAESPESGRTYRANSGPNDNILLITIDGPKPEDPKRDERSPTPAEEVLRIPIGLKTWRVTGGDLHHRLLISIGGEKPEDSEPHVIELDASKGPWTFMHHPGTDTLTASFGGEKPGVHSATSQPLDF